MMIVKINNYNFNDNYCLFEKFWKVVQKVAQFQRHQSKILITQCFKKWPKWPQNEKIEVGPLGLIIENRKAEFFWPVGRNRKAEFDRKAENQSTLISAQYINIFFCYENHLVYHDVLIEKVEKFTLSLSSMKMCNE